MKNMHNYSYISWLAGTNIHDFSIRMLYHWKDICVQFPTQQTVHLWTYELGVTTILVEATHAVLLLREKPMTLQFLHQDDLPLVFFMLMFTPNQEGRS